MKFEKLSNSNLRQALNRFSHDDVITGILPDNILFVTKFASKQSEEKDHTFQTEILGNGKYSSPEEAKNFVNSLPRCVLNQILWEFSNRIEHSSDWKQIGKFGNGCLQDILRDFMTFFDVIDLIPGGIYPDSIGCQPTLRGDVRWAQDTFHYKWGSVYSVNFPLVVPLVYYLVYGVTGYFNIMRIYKNDYYSEIRNSDRSDKSYAKATHKYQTACYPVIREMLLDFILTWYDEDKWIDWFEAWKNGRC